VPAPPTAPAARGRCRTPCRKADAVQRLVELEVEIVDPELVEIAQYDVLRAVGDKVEPVVEGLPIVALQFLALLLHLQQEARPPEQVGEAGGPALADAVFQGAAGLQDAGLAERPEEAVAEDLRFPLLVAGQVRADEGDEFTDLRDGVVHGTAMLRCMRR
jgi:hypothetical protein